MNKKLLILLLIVILTALMTACNKKTETSPTGNDSSSYGNDPESSDSDAQGDNNISSTDSSSEISGKPGQGDTQDENTQTDIQETEAATTDTGTRNNNRTTDNANGQTEDTATDAAGALADDSDIANCEPSEDSEAAVTDAPADTSKTSSTDDEKSGNNEDSAANEPIAEDNTQKSDGANDSTAQDEPETSQNNQDTSQKSDVDFMTISKTNVPEYYITATEAKPVESLNPDMSTKWLPVSQDNPISVESSLSKDSPLADFMNIGSYEEEKFDVFRYTYDCVNGCWRFTETAQRGFYFYSMHDMSDPENRSEWPRMRRCYYSDGGFQTEYLETDDWFYAPYEDDEGNIYAECGRYISGGMSETPDVYISKMDQDGKTLSKVRISDLKTEGLTYLGFAYIKKDIIAVIYNQTLENSKQGTQLQFIDLKAKKLTGILYLEDEISLKIKSDGDYFILTSASYQRVYVFDINTYELKNTVDTTKCKELCVYEWRVNDFESGRYSSLSYNVDIKDGKLYFLRHSGVYVTDCLKSEFSKLLDGLLFADFINQQYVYTSFFVGKDEDFYLLGVCVDEESATTMWHYTKKD